MQDAAPDAATFGEFGDEGLVTVDPETIMALRMSTRMWQWLAFGTKWCPILVALPGLCGAFCP